MDGKDIFIAIVIFIAGCLLIDRWRLENTIKIYFSNYINALKVIAELDPASRARINKAIEDAIQKEKERTKYGTNRNS